MKPNKRGAQVILATIAIVLLGIMAEATVSYVLPVDPMNGPAVGIQPWNVQNAPGSTWRQQGRRLYESPHAPAVPQPWTRIPTRFVPSTTIRSPIAGAAGRVISGRPYFTGVAPQFSSLPRAPLPERNYQEPWRVSWPYSVYRDPIGSRSQHYPYAQQGPWTATPREIWCS